MVQERIIETNEGIQDAVTVSDFDIFARRMRDKGYIETDAIIKSGIISGSALEVGPGPGYLGLEWLSKTHGTRLTGCEISDNMRSLAEKNAASYGFTERAAYVKGNALNMPFPADRFDAVFSNGSLHEWENPVSVFNEIFRVLVRNGRFFVSDLRRDMNPVVKWLLKRMCKPRSMVQGLVSSLNAAYTPRELNDILTQSAFTDFNIQAGVFGLIVTGRKP
ncbi:MAG TPA: class I SAM-dependent methyltransferase [Spirochaetia bacterium]|nr:class I SAM-dependent methyltransferase [Spirochaetia bacterium]